MIEHINWYPGHMKKTRELIEENLKAVDLVIELIDSRIPVSGENPMIGEMLKGKERIVVLAKADLAEEAATKEWLEHFSKRASGAIAIDVRNKADIKRLIKLLSDREKQLAEKRKMNRALRLMIVGIPNVGKSSLINALAGRKSAQTGNKPGVTRGKQWLTISSGMQLLDTPGILWPKFEDNEVGLHLAFCGSIKDDILGVQDLAFELIRFLEKEYPDRLMQRYGLEDLSDETLENMEHIAEKRGCLLPGRRIDYERTGRMVLNEFREGLLGRITIEKAEATEGADATEKADRN